MINHFRPGFSATNDFRTSSSVCPCVSSTFGGGDVPRTGLESVFHDSDGGRKATDLTVQLRGVRVVQYL